MPSATETLLALGLGPVGCTRFCDDADATVVGGTKSVDVDAVVALEPDLVVVNDEENRLEDANALDAHGSRCTRCRRVRSPTSVPRSRRWRPRSGREPAAPWTEWDAWLDRTRRPVRHAAFVPIWRRPWMSLAADTYGSSLLAHVGISNVSPARPTGIPRSRWRTSPGSDPISRCCRASRTRSASGTRPRSAPRCPACAATFVDGRDLFWWGVRTPAAAERLQHIA